MHTSWTSEIAAITRIGKKAEWPAGQRNTAVLELMFRQTKIQNLEGERLRGAVGFEVIAKTIEKLVFAIVQQSKDAPYVRFPAELLVDSTQDSLDPRAGDKWWREAVQRRSARVFRTASRFAHAERVHRKTSDGCKVLWL